MVKAPHLVGLALPPGLATALQKHHRFQARLQTFLELARPEAVATQHVPGFALGGFVPGFLRGFDGLLRKGLPSGNGQATSPLLGASGFVP